MNDDDIIYCTHCGAKNSSDAQFCAQCGQRLVKPEAVSAPLQDNVDTNSEQSTTSTVMAAKDPEIEDDKSNLNFETSSDSSDQEDETTKLDSEDSETSTDPFEPDHTSVDESESVDQPTEPQTTENSGESDQNKANFDFADGWAKCVALVKNNVILAILAAIILVLGFIESWLLGFVLAAVLFIGSLYIAQEKGVGPLALEQQLAHLFTKRPTSAGQLSITRLIVLIGSFIVLLSTYVGHLINVDLSSISSLFGNEISELFSSLGLSSAATQFIETTINGTFYAQLKMIGQADSELKNYLFPILLLLAAGPILVIVGQFVKARQGQILAFVGSIVAGIVYFGGFQGLKRLIVDQVIKASGADSSTMQLFGAQVINSVIKVGLMGYLAGICIIVLIVLTGYQLFHQQTRSTSTH
ncbi:zinc-ribbon domain-containing protein [Lapidilactobacillus mulanensis]|uniref:Zinc-ribbon domain-containing protein n=1 Tax=Lapidilactobacillus mulanensis TaxID=2485999 RepID=A0ABW4DTN0_9LACO|nr:zinc ribbon domain-containing protein [Lapidilactobacillus mulanensis]